MDEQSRDDQVRKAIKKIGSVGSKVFGATIGAVVAKETGMPMAGAITSAYLSEQMNEVYGIVIEGQFAARKRKRAGDAAIAIASNVAVRLDAGDAMRADDFFTRNADERSSSDETLEAALDAAMSSFEEQKIAFIANLTAAICFDNTVNTASAQMFISMLRRLSLRSIMIIAACDDAMSLALDSRPRIGTELLSGSEAVFSEYFLLVTLNLLQRVDIVDGHIVDVLSSHGVDPGQMRLTKLGQKLSELAKLKGARDLPAWQECLVSIREATAVGTAGHSVDVGVYDGQAAAKRSKLSEEQERDLKFSTAMSIANM